jgi:hypothetical protein
MERLFFRMTFSAFDRRNARFMRQIFLGKIGMTIDARELRVN